MILQQLFEASPGGSDNYAEQLAQKVFNVKPDLASEDDVLNTGHKVATQDLMSQVRANYLFARDQDFPSDFVSAYYHLKKQGVAEDSLNEFAPGNDGGESGRWYTDSELADIIGDDWFEDFDVSNDGFNMDAHGEKAKKNLVGYANSWFDDKGYNVNVLGVENNEVDHDLQWYVVGSFHNPNFADKNIDEGSQRVDSLVTDALKIMRGPEVSDAVAALKTVLGDREYNGRRGHYNFYIKQILDMYGQQGMAEDANKEPAPNSSLAHYMKKRAELANKKGLGEEGELDEVLGFVIGQPKQAKKPAVSLATMRKEFEKERPETIQKTVRGNDDPKNVKYVRTVAAEAGPYGSRNPDTMSSNEYDRYQQDQMDSSKRDFKRREHEAEWEQEKAYSDKLAARDGGSWYIRINGKVLKDKQQQPYTFQGKAAANKAALTMMAKAFNKGKKFTLTTSDTDAVATQPIAESAVPAKPKHRRW